MRERVCILNTRPTFLQFRSLKKRKNAACSFHDRTFPNVLTSEQADRRIFYVVQKRRSSLLLFGNCEMFRRISGEDVFHFSFPMSTTLHVLFFTLNDALAIYQTGVGFFGRRLKSQKKTSVHLIFSTSRTRWN